LHLYARQLLDKSDWHVGVLSKLIKSSLDVEVRAVPVDLVISKNLKETTKFIVFFLSCQFVSTFVFSVNQLIEYSLIEFPDRRMIQDLRPELFIIIFASFFSARPPLKPHNELIR
jgi:hypothetical protein